MKHKQILVVEDEGSVALDIKKGLQSLGYSVSGIVSSGENSTLLLSGDPPGRRIAFLALVGHRAA